MSFRLDLDMFRGPLDLLLYLVRKQEIEVAEVPLHMVAEQYIAYLDLLQQLSVDDVGDFIEIASTLLEIKARSVLPRVEEEAEQIEDPREELVQRLLEYKKYKDAASMLEERGRQWQCRFPRLADDLPSREVDLGSQPIREIELWDLVSAIGRIIREAAPEKSSQIVYDDTPIHVYMRRIHERLVSQRRARMSDLMEPGMHKSAMIGVFLAILELVRHYNVRTEQDGHGGEIVLLPTEQFLESPPDFSKADSYDLKVIAGEMPVKPR